MLTPLDLSYQETIKASLAHVNTSSLNRRSLLHIQAAQSSSKCVFHSSTASRCRPCLVKDFMVKIAWRRSC
jgi:hypothetical protein